MRNDGVDISEWQSSARSPVFADMGGYQMVALRVHDGAHVDESLASYYAQTAQLPARWKLLYSLPDPALGIDGNIATFRRHCESVGIRFPLPVGWGISWDDEGTFRVVNGRIVGGHDRYRGSDAVGYYEALTALSGHDAILDYTHPLQENYPLLVMAGWPSWFPWPIQRDVRPSDGIIVPDVHQWGVAGPGEQPGFPDVSVDVDQINHPAALDRVTGQGDFDMAAVQLEALSNDQLQQMFNAVMQTRQSVGLTAQQSQQMFNAAIHGEQLSQAVLDTVKLVLTEVTKTPGSTTGSGLSEAQVSAIVDKVVAARFQKGGA